MPLLFEDILKANPYHDPKTGRFTFAPGGSGPVRNSNGEKLTEAQSKFFAGSQAVDEDGDLMVLHHGTVHDFTEFDTSLANPENDMGQGIYLTNNEYDSHANYGSEEGPDLKGKIDRYTEYLQANGMDYDEAEALAKKEFITAEPKVLDCYVNVQNPIKLGGKDETFFDFDDGYDHDAEDYTREPSGKMLDFYNSIEKITREGDFDISEKDDFLESVRTRLYDNSLDNGGIRAKRAIEEVNDAAFVYEVYKENSYGDWSLAGKELIRQAFEDMGYDGIIDKTVSEKFGAMQGMTDDTTHYIVFNSNQVKLIDNQNPTNSNDITKGGVF